MTTWFVTRHEGALDWARQQGIINEQDEVRCVGELSAQQVTLGDVVIGTLPVHLAGEICARGARYLHITMTVPAERRGNELSAEEMAAFGASCQQFHVLAAHDTPATSQPFTAPPAGRGVHLCLVSDQYMANLLPILKRRPAAIELVCTPEALKPGKGFDTLLRALLHFGYEGRQITRYEIDAECGTDFLAARQAARELRDSLLADYPEQPVTLNATGGTKILSTAFFVEFQGIETIYTDSQSGNCIRFLDDLERRPEALGKQFGAITDYFFCQGYGIVDSALAHPALLDAARQRKSVTRMLAEQGRHVVLGIFNSAAQDFATQILGKNGGKNTPAVERVSKLDAALPSNPISRLKAGWLTKKLCSAGLLLPHGDNSFAFANAEAMRYLSGGWIEEWAWHIATECRPDQCDFNVYIRSLADGDKPTPDGDESDNEIDLVMLHDNRLLIAECKTIFWQGANAKQDIFNKLDALGTHARGLFGKSLLVSAKELDKKAARRARAYGINVLQAETLFDLKDEIQSWMGSARAVR